MDSQSKDESATASEIWTPTDTNFYLQEGFLVVVKRIERGQECNELVQQMLEDRLKCDEEYSLSLKKFATKYKSKLPGVPSFWFSLSSACV